MVLSSTSIAINELLMCDSVKRMRKFGVLEFTYVAQNAAAARLCTSSFLLHFDYSNGSDNNVKKYLLAVNRIDRGIYETYDNSKECHLEKHH